MTGAAPNGYQKPPPKVMICNRGEIARRVIRTANHHGLDTVAIYTQVGTLTLSLCVSREDQERCELVCGEGKEGLAGDGLSLGLCLAVCCLGLLH